MHNTIVRVGGPRVARAAAGGGLIATVVRQRPVDGNPGTELQSGSPGPSTDRSRRRAETVPGASLPVGLPSEHDEFREHPPPQLGFAAAPTAGIRDHSRQNFGVFGAVPPVVEGARTGEALLRIVGMAAHDGPVGQGDDQMLLD